MKIILTDILRGCELTVCRDHTYWMNKYRSNWYQVDEKICLCLIQSNAIIEDSGNFETGERHYVLDYDYVFNNKLKNINFLISKVNTKLNCSPEILNELKILKLREERRLKLKKIKQIC